MFCLRCNIERYPGLTRCPECSTMLVLRFPNVDALSAPRSDSELVVLRTYNNQFDADLARATLEAAGIESMLRSDNCGGRGPHLAFIRGIEILVLAEDADDADAILNLDATGSATF